MGKVVIYYLGTRAERERKAVLENWTTNRKREYKRTEKLKSVSLIPKRKNNSYKKVKEHQKEKDTRYKR